MKHAYLIIAYNQPLLLQKLIWALDDERNDIFIHIDQKFDINTGWLNVKKSALYILSEMMNVHWGDVSLVKVELLLIKEMLKHGPYQYCHLISGCDFPIKSQDYIHDWCDRWIGKEFIGYASRDGLEKEISDKVQYYYLFAKHFKNANLFQRSTRYMFLSLQHLFGYKRNKKIVFKKGSQWCSITYDFAQYLYDRKDIILKMYRHTFCADEIFIQTVCWNSKFRKNIYRDDDFEGCLRFIKWKDNVINPINKSDIDNMIYSDRWFARKFSENQIELIEDISKKI